MIKKFTLIFLLTFIFYPFITTKSQIWVYDFGTDTATYNSPGQSLEFLPEAEMGTSLVAVSSDGGGSFHLDSLELFGDDIYLMIVAPNTTDPSTTNKFSIIDIIDSTSLFTIRFNILFSGNSGLFQFFNGFNVGGDSRTFTGTQTATNSQIFAGLQWQMISPDSITTSFRSGNDWDSTSALGLGIKGKFKQNLNYTVDIYSNNSNSIQSYTYNGSQNVAPNRWDLWVDGVLIGDELNKPSNGIIAGSTINSFTFIGRNSTDNSDTVFVDNIFYSNDIPSEPLPVELTSFTASVTGTTVQLNWRTETEVMNYGFEVERLQDYKNAKLQDWEKIGFVQGHGNSNSPKDYYFTDSEVKAGEYSYRLKQIDTDGQYEYFGPVSVDFGQPQEFVLEQNYPNPFNPITTISFMIPEDGNVKLTVFNILGQEIAALINEPMQAGIHSVDFDASALNSGLYLYKIETGDFTQIRKMLLIK
jgi:hypothetical protein